MRTFGRLLVAGRDRDRAVAVAKAARNFIASCEVVDFETAANGADVLLTLTPASDPIVRDDWIRPGTHINAVGADTAGKCELEPSLLGRARVFYDEWKQAETIGECQRAVAAGMLDKDRAGGSLGDVVRGAVTGRTTDQDITVFDSTGVALQDVAIARLAVDAAADRLMSANPV